MGIRRGYSAGFVFAAAACYSVELNALRELMLKKLRQFAALNFQQKSIFIEAWFLLGWMRVAILAVSFKRLVRALEHHRGTTAALILDECQITQALEIGFLVERAARYTPWQSRCLAQVLVVQRLLSARGISGQFFLAVRKGRSESAKPDSLFAHAWVRCGDVIVNGGHGHEQFVVVSSFSWRAGKPF